MHSHRRPRGRIFFEAVCALTAGVSFVGAWIQTGAWAFIGPAFVFTLFGLYWALDLFGSDSPSVAAEPATAVAAEPASEPEIRFERFEPLVEPAPAPTVERFDEPEVHTDVVPFVSEPEPAVRAEPVVAEAPSKGKKARSKKAADPIVEQAPVVADEEPAFDHHIEQLFDPKPFARQSRPAFGKRPRGPGPRPLPAA